MPYLTNDLPGIGGRIKEYLEDFCVEEIPLYEPCGEGTHVYFRVVKRGIPTPAAVDRIAKYMGVKPADIGFAGMKDAKAVTSQVMSIEHVDPDKLAAYRDRDMEIVWTSRHTNKLRTGHLAGNRFAVRIRGVGRAQLADAERILEVLKTRGAPNYFGPQRFGGRGDTHLLGEALVRNDLDEFISIFLGRPQDDDPPDCKAARDAFDSGYFNRALDRWPWHYTNERKALSIYRKKRHVGPAVAIIDKRMKRLYVSAFQSELFNEVLSRRIDSIDRVFAGDLACKTDTGGVFTVEDVAAEQERADRFEISPTGMVPGYRSSLAEGEPGKIEREVLAAHNIGLDQFKHIGPLKISGSRRALRFRLADCGISPGRDERGEYLELKFTAEAGCYATVVLREIMKND